MTPLLRCALLFVSSVQEMDAPEGLAWMAIRDINAVYDDDAEPMNRPPVVLTPPKGMIRAVDVSHDGRPDWLVDYGASDTNAYCGTGGCLLRLYVSAGDDYIQAMDAQVLRLTFADDGVQAQAHPALCRDRDPCLLAWRWDEAGGRLTPTPASDGRPVATGEFALFTARQNSGPE